MTWFNTKSWQPDLLIDRRSLTQATVFNPDGKEEPVEPNQRASVHYEPEPGTIAWLYQDYGGES